MKNLLMISLDTVRADVAYSGKFPGIEELRREGVTFLNTISSSPLTPISHATVLTGLQPYHHGIRHLFKEKLANNAKTITEELKKMSYQTGAIVSCPGMNKWYDFCRGFDHYDDEIPLLADGTDPLQTIDVKKRGTALKRAPLVIERASAWLDSLKTDKQFFLFIHFFDAHWPYEAPENFGGANNYEREVAYSDHFLAKFMKKLKEKKLWDETTIVCFSDHGEDLNGLYSNDKGGEVLGHPEEFGHGNLLYDQTQKVVLIMKDSKLQEGSQIVEQVRLVDVAPTILDLLEIESKDFCFDGVSLSPIIAGEKFNLPDYSETYYPEEQIEATGGKFKEAKNKTAIRINNRYKYIVHLASEEKEFYDLIPDPDEKNNIF